MSWDWKFFNEGGTLLTVSLDEMKKFLNRNNLKSSDVHISIVTYEGDESPDVILIYKKTRNRVGKKK